MEPTSLSPAKKFIIGSAIALTTALPMDEPNIAQAQSFMTPYYQAHNSSRPFSNKDEDDFFWHYYPPVKSQFHLDKFTFTDKPEVDLFLAANPEILPRLGEAYANIKKFFPVSTLNMRILTDSEIENTKLLAIYISIDIEPEYAFNKLNDLWDQWICDSLGDLNRKIMIDVKFV